MSSRERQDGPDRKRPFAAPAPTWSLLSIWLIVCAAAGPSGARTWHVPQERPTIGDGLAAATAGDTVLVACGVYPEPALEMTEGVVLRSETGEADCVTVDALWQGRGISCENLSAATAIEGLTFTNGVEVAAGAVFCNHANVIFRDCAFTDCFTNLDGAGFYCNESAPLLERCVFTDNVSDAGAGGGFCSRMSDPVLRGCVFTGNRAGSWGGGFHATGSDNVPWLEKCVFTGNRAEVGGAVACKGTLARFIDCELIDNEATTAGGGLYLDFGALVAATDVICEGNAAPDGKAGLVTASCTILLQCCTLDRTALTGDGLIVYDDADCGVANARSAWGDVKRLYR